MNTLRIKWLATFFVAGICFGCSGGSETSQSDAQSNANQINTEKLVGTPLEGLTTGDSLGWCQFQLKDYQTLKVPAFPIPIFLAFFTDAEEELIGEGIQMANNAAGIEVYRVADQWSNEDRILYKVAEIADPDITGISINASGKTMPTDFNAEGGGFRDLIVIDWQIELEPTAVSPYVVAHELGHSLGIRSHALIDYENDTLTELEPNSLIAAYPGIELKDYTYMMQKQAALYQRHVGEVVAKENVGGICRDKILAE